MNFYTIITTIVNIITAVTTISVVGFIMGDVSHVVVLLPFSVIIIFYHHYQIVICYFASSRGSCSGVCPVRQLWPVTCVQWQ